jgi:Tol biopolymer transport system component/DNA-binding winged helix-turn-helix (wHTH) protein
MSAIMLPETGHSYEFGTFRLDPTEKTLSCEGKPVSLAPKVFETLQIFVEHAGRLLEKDELMQRLWQDRFVEESNLTFNIKMLRRVLNDDAHQPRFIETVPRRGYRFIAEVKETFADIAAKTQLDKAGSDVLPAPKASYWPIAALVVFVIGLIVIALWLGRSKYAASVLSAPILSASFKSERFSTFSNTPNLQAVITPDGKFVAYTSETGGKQDIWLRQLETSENIQIVPPSEHNYLGLAISHDGNSLYFVRQNQTDQTPAAVYRVMTFGGIPAKLIEKAEGWISVSPDDRQISFVRCKYQDDDFCSLFVADTDGKNERRLLTRPRPIRIGDNQFSPDGKSIAYAIGQSSSGGSDFRLMRVDLASGAESAISPKTFFNIKSLKWLPEGDRLLLTAKEHLDGRLRIWQVSVGTGEARVLTNDASNYASISLDRAADKMIATYVSNSFHLYLAQMGDLSNPKVLPAARLSVTFAPDGRIIYSGDDGFIWAINRDGGGQRQLTNSSFTDFEPRVSPDGHYIFFASNRSASNQVWRMNADGSNQIEITNREGGYPLFVTLDGKWTYFHSLLHQTLWRVSTDGGEEIQVSEGKVSEPAFSTDGNFVAYFVRAKENDKRIKIAVMSVASGKILKTFALADEKSNPVKIAWASDKSFNFITTNESQNSLWSQALQDDSPRLIANMGNEEIGGFALSPDGNSLAFIRGKWIHDAVLIEGLK